MRHLMILAALGTCTVAAGGCATTDGYASACERDYARNRQYATASGAALGAIAGAAVDKDDPERGAAIGALAGGLLGNQLSAEDDPCGYGFGGYNRDHRYGTERVYWRDEYRPYPRY